MFQICCIVVPVTSQMRTWRKRECSTPPTNESCWRAWGSSKSSNRNELYRTGLWLVLASLVQHQVPRGQISAELDWAGLCQSMPDCAFWEKLHSIKYLKTKQNTFWPTIHFHLYCISVVEVSLFNKKHFSPSSITTQPSALNLMRRRRVRWCNLYRHAQFKSKTRVCVCVWSCWWIDPALCVSYHQFWPAALWLR